MIMRVRLASILGVIGLLLTVCSFQLTQDQSLPKEQISLGADQSLGQSFLSTFSGLNGIQVFLAPESAGDGQVILHLKSSVASPSELVTSKLPVAAVKGADFYRFDFPAISASQFQDFYAWFEIDGNGSLVVGVAEGSSYQNGSLYQDHSPVDAQLTFNLFFAPGSAFFGLVLTSFRGLGFLCLAILILVLPGWGLLKAFWPSWNSQDGWTRLTVSTGTSLALYPLLFLWADMAGLRVGALMAWVPALIGLGLILWSYRRHLLGKPLPHAIKSGLGRVSLKMLNPANLTMTLILILLTGLRLWEVRTLEAPMWGDSIQHTAIAQLILDNQGLFKSWEPYAPYESLTVQYGFPAFAALLSWITNLTAVKSTLLAGQIIHILAALNLYPLAQRLSGGNRWAGVGAVLVAGLFSLQPAVYTNWGRYAQGAGQAVLPIALWLLWEAIDKISPTTGSNSFSVWLRLNITPFLFAAGSLAGMTLIYYRMPFYYASFALALLIGWGIPKAGRHYQHWLWMLLRLAVVGGLGIFLFLPWGFRLIGSNLAQTVETGVSGSNQLSFVSSDYLAWKAVFEQIPSWLAIITAIGFAWSMIRRQWAIACLALWAALLAGIPALTLLRVPGASMLQSFAVIIALYIMISLVLGWMLSEIANGLRHPRLLSGLVLMAALAGAWSQRDLVDPNYFAMVTRPDMHAMDWIRANTPRDSRFLVEAFRIYNGASAVGADAGWWIPLLTNRQNTMPPQYALLNEIPSQPGYTQQVVKLVEVLETTPLDSSEGLNLLCNTDISYVYIGQGQGQVSFGNLPLYTAEELIGRPEYRLVYRQDRVWIFALAPGVCD